MDVKKVAFIICSNDEQYLKECQVYINALAIPEGMRIEIIPVIGAKSMCSGYNIGMNYTDAKYKVYMHQDVFILNRNLILDFIKIFNADDRIGMIGVAGSNDLPSDAICFSEWNVGSVLEYDGYRIMMYLPSQIEQINYVWAVDGLMIITNRDLPWREDVFDMWDFYDVSQGMEFMEAGYRVAVPYQEHPWCFHDNGILNLEFYDRNRKIFCDTYSKYFRYDEPESHRKKNSENKAGKKAAKKVVLKLRQLFDEGRLEEAIKLASENHNYKNKDNDLFSLYTISAIILEEWRAGKNCLAKKERNTDELLRTYQEIRFTLFRIAFDIDNERNLREQIENGEISVEALDLLINLIIYDKTKVYQKLLSLGIAVPKPVEENFYCTVCGHRNTVIHYHGEEKIRQRDYNFHYVDVITENFSDDHCVCPACRVGRLGRFLKLFLAELIGDEGQVIQGLNIVSNGNDNEDVEIVIERTDFSWETGKSEILRIKDNNSVDLILGINLLQNEVDDLWTIHEISRVMKRDGLGILTVPVNHDLSDTVEVGEIGDAGRMQETGTYDARRFYTEQNFVHRLNGSGLMVQKITPEYFGEVSRISQIGDDLSMYIVTHIDIGIQGIPLG